MKHFNYTYKCGFFLGISGFNIEISMYNQWKRINLIAAHLSSPARALSMASGSSDLSKLCVTLGEPRHNVDNKLVTVDMLAFALLSAPPAPGRLDPGVDVKEAPGAGPEAAFLTNKKIPRC